MASFVYVKEQRVWINLDYVVRIDSGSTEEEATVVTFANGSTMTLSGEAARKLLRQIRPKKKKKKKKGEERPSESPAPEEGGDREGETAV